MTSLLKYSNTKFSIKDVCVEPEEPESAFNRGTIEDSEISSNNAEKIIKNCNCKKFLRCSELS